MLLTIRKADLRKTAAGARNPHERKMLRNVAKEHIDEIKAVHRKNS